MHEGFVYLDEFLPGIRWDAKYATTDNFTGKKVTGYETNRIVGTKELAQALSKVKVKAEELGYGLLLWDGFRPQMAVDCFYEWSKLPEDDSTKERFYPNILRGSMISDGYVALKSGHSRGSTIDLTLFDLKTSEVLPMGTDFDFMDEKSHHGAAGISPVATKNRLILRKLMEDNGFVAFEQEWWHYTLKNEPFCDEYFNFPIK